MKRLELICVLVIISVLLSCNLLSIKRENLIGKYELVETTRNNQFVLNNDSTYYHIIIAGGLTMSLDTGKWEYGYDPDFREFILTLYDFNDHFDSNHSNEGIWPTRVKRHFNGDIGIDFDEDIGLYFKKLN